MVMVPILRYTPTLVEPRSPVIATRKLKVVLKIALEFSYPLISEPFVTHRTGSRLERISEIK